MKNILVLGLFISIIYNAQAQRKNAAYVELGGNALTYSVNYERKIVKELGIRAGIGIVSIPNNNTKVITVPAMTNYCFGKKHQLEIGAGVCFLTVRNDSLKNVPFALPHFTSNVLYRYNASSGLLFRVGFAQTYIIKASEYNSKDNFWPKYLLNAINYFYPTLSVGYSF